MEETSFWLVRHAAVDAIEGAIHGPDAPANLRDRVHLEAVRRRLPREATAYASPSRRTLDTAQALGLAPVIVPEFAEQDFGDWTGRRHDDLASTMGESYSRFWSDPAHSSPPGGESFADQITRVGHGLTKVVPGSTVLVVHSGTIRALLCIALEIAPQAALRFVIDPLSITRIDRLRNNWRVVSVNQNVMIAGRLLE